jgi:hypothetical protein
VLGPGFKIFLKINLLKLILKGQLNNWPNGNRDKLEKIGVFGGGGVLKKL